MILSNPSSPSHYLGYLLAIVPAIICGCSREIKETVHPPQTTETVNLSISEYVHTDESTLDIFAFENDSQRRLDSYQRIYDFKETASISSSGGDKIFFLCINGQRDIYGWSSICSYTSLESIYCNLEYESLTRKSMTGETATSAGSQNLVIEFKPLTCEIVIETIGYDFKGTTYPEASIKNVKIYLTNVCATYPLRYGSNYKASRIINTGMLNPDDLKNFRYPEIIARTVAEKLEDEIMYPDIRLLCYPNIPEEESPGSPHTRLVIEGEINGHLYFWPISINNGNGIERGHRYVYNLFITRKGVTDPDIPVEPQSIEIKTTIKPWKEKEEYSVGF